MDFAKETGKGGWSGKGGEKNRPIQTKYPRINSKEMIWEIWSSKRSKYGKMQPKHEYKKLAGKETEKSKKKNR